MQKVSDYILDDLTRQLEKANNLIKTIQNLTNEDEIIMIPSDLKDKEFIKFINKNDKLIKLIRDNYEL